MRRALWFVVVGLLLAPAVPAQVTTSTSGDVPLDGSKGRKTKKPRFELPGVTVNKKLTLDKKNGNVTQECTFKNGGSGNVDFFFCDMIALEDGGTQAESTNTCNITFDAAKNEWKCVLGNNTKSSNPPSYHFGCVEVHLGPGGTFTGPSQSGGNIDFAGEEAQDLQINYADIFDLSGGATFNSGSCQTLKCFGVNRDTNMESSVQRPDGTGFWIIEDYPLTASYVVWQDLGGTRHSKEYVSLDAGLSVPSTFPAAVAQLGRTSPFDVPPSTFDMDLNLWDMFTMSDPPEEVTPVRIEVYMTDPVPGISFTVDPEDTGIVGGTMEFGTLTLHRQGEAFDLPEGTVAELSVAIYDPREPDYTLWEQDGDFIQDTEPATVDAHSEVFLDAQNLAVSITATDVTTSPTAANFWYSTDGGLTWTAQPLTSQDLSGEPPTVTFEAVVEIPTAVEIPDEDFAGMSIGPPIQFFYNVQDRVYNNVWFGVGTMVNPSIPDGGPLHRQ